MEKKVSETSGKSGSRAEIEILKMYTVNPDAEFHLRQLARKLDMNHRTVRSHIDSLKAKNLILEEERGRNKVFTLNQKHPQLDYHLSVAELDRTIRFLRTEKEIRVIWEALEKRWLEKDWSRLETVALFGSFAEGTSDDESDVDLFLSVRPQFKDLDNIKRAADKVGSTHGRTINLEVVRGLQNFIHTQASASFKEIIRNHVVLYGAENWVKAVRRFSK